MMMNVDLQQLIRVLTAQTRRDLERAAERCITRGGSEVLVEDLLLVMLGHPEELGQHQVGQAALVLALLRNPQQHAGSCYQPVLGKLDTERLRSLALSDQHDGLSVAAPERDESMLRQFTHDLTFQAREGKIDPVLCRDAEVRQMIDILIRRRKNNPIIVGEAGVGKTALVEGLAWRIVNAQVPAVLKNVRLLTLDLGLLQADAGIKGEFERRLKGVIEAVNACAQPVILFIDEAHTLIGAGSQPGSSDAANLLKPALARGELRTIAATTWTEYRRYFEKDPALARRFQPVQIRQPAVNDTVTILRGLAPVYEASHGVYVRDDAVVAAAQLSARYLTGRQLPDKAVDALDTACARVRISLETEPQALQQLKAELAQCTSAQQALNRDRLTSGMLDSSALQVLAQRSAAIAVEYDHLQRQWVLQRDLVERVHSLRQQLTAARQSGHDPQRRVDEFEQQLRQAHAALQAVHLLPLVVDRPLEPMAAGKRLHRVHGTLDAGDRVICEFA